MHPRLLGRRCLHQDFQDKGIVRMATVMAKTPLSGAGQVRLQFGARKKTMLPLAWDDFCYWGDSRWTLQGT